MVAALQILTLIWLIIPFAHSRRHPFLTQPGEPGRARRRTTPPAGRYLFDWEKAAGPDRPKLVVQNEKTAKFAVNGTGIPYVNFDVGESYAGLLPIGNDTSRELYFWYFPTSNPAGKDDLTVWLNGGPGCSSLEGFLQENGPFLWNYGTYRPVSNPWSWHLLSNVLWVEQPVGTGYTRGRPREFTQRDVANSFVDFFRNFVDTFDLHGKKLYLTGESYAGYYVPYIAEAMFDANDTRYFNVQGTMIYDPSINDDIVLRDMPVAAFVEAYDNVFRLNDTFMAYVRERAQTCGFTDLFAKHLTFPPSGPMPALVGSKDLRYNLNPCGRLWRDIFAAVTAVNPCFNFYHIQTTCPLLWDVLGFPGSFEYLPDGAFVYFDLPEVKAAINAPADATWIECNEVPLTASGRASEDTYARILPAVIERSKRTVVAHGTLDFVLIANGTLLALQNMTWGGARGFQQRPGDDFYVPYHWTDALESVAGAGVLGVTATERGLTWVEVFTSGHMIPQYAPSAAFRMLEFLLGRVDDLSGRQPFTLVQQRNVPQPPPDPNKKGKGRGRN